MAKKRSSQKKKGTEIPREQKGTESPREQKTFGRSFSQVRK
jgi:hypothetical protein